MSTKTRGRDGSAELLPYSKLPLDRSDDELLRHFTDLLTERASGSPRPSVRSRAVHEPRQNRQEDPGGCATEQERGGDRNSVHFGDRNDLFDPEPPKQGQSHKPDCAYGDGERKDLLEQARNSPPARARDAQVGTGNCTVQPIGHTVVRRDGLGSHEPRPRLRKPLRRAIGEPAGRARDLSALNLGWWRHRGPDLRPGRAGKAQPPQRIGAEPPHPPDEGPT